MKNNKWEPYILFIVLTEAVGVLAGWLTRSGIEAYNALPKPPLTPPNTVFPIVWTVLYALMGIGAARIWMAPPSQARSYSLRLFAVQLVVNFFWSIFFFNLQAFGFSFLWLVLLWVLIVLMILSYSKVDKLAAWLQVPYLLWVTFAGYLNYATWLLNR
ncbi:MAG: TspO/MBR family protein [Angelakisella sp.]